MLQRRTLVWGFACAAIGAGAIAIPANVRAQRPAHPIARPPLQRPGGPLSPGRFSPDGVASGTLPGVYTVDAVDTRGETLQLRDDSGRTGTVHVNGDMFDLASLKAGDQVEVDFVVPQPGSTRLEAGGLWKVQR